MKKAGIMFGEKIVLSEEELLKNLALFVEADNFQTYNDYLVSDLNTDNNQAVKVNLQSLKGLPTINSRGDDSFNKKAMFYAALLNNKKDICKEIIQERYIKPSELYREMKRIESNENKAFSIQDKESFNTLLKELKNDCLDAMAQDIYDEEQRFDAEYALSKKETVKVADYAGEYKKAADEIPENMRIFENSINKIKNTLQDIKSRSDNDPVRGEYISRIENLIKRKEEYFEKTSSRLLSMPPDLKRDFSCGIKSDIKSFDNIQEKLNRLNKKQSKPKEKNSISSFFSEIKCKLREIKSPTTSSHHTTGCIIAPK